MKKNLENSFISKFDLLNSQEDSEDIIWNSDSSDNENCINECSKISKHICLKKRKRVVNKSKLPKNISQLDITFIESEQKNKSIIKLSPESSRKKSPKISCKSPLLTNSQRHFVPYNLKHVDKSPIILSKTRSCNYIEKLDSPVLSFRHISSIKSPIVKKKLFNPKNEVENITCEERSKSPILSISQSPSISMISKDTKQIQSPSNNLLRNIKNTDNRFNSLDNIKDNFLSLKSNLPLIENIKSYFDSHFNSNTSQSASISECETENERNSSKSIEDIEIINSQPELEPIFKSESKYSSNSLSYENESEISKKVKYKKDGLAFRLNVLKKRQNANTSLWLHERFLAANSSFMLPSEDFLIFRIKKVSIKYGCHLIEVSDVTNEKYLIILSNIYVHNNNMKKDDVFKLYKPYNILECTDYKLIINLCKYECVGLKNNKWY